MLRMESSDSSRIPNAPRRRPRADVTSRRLADLSKQERQRALIRALVTIILSWVIIIGAFYLLPIGKEGGASLFVRLSVDLALVGLVLAAQTRRITRAELPELRAVEALGIVVAFFLVVFSTIYLTMSHGSVSTFSQPLDHTRALYFTITVFSTVGFGDIAPRTDTARILVSTQMLLDLIIIGAVVRLLINAAKTSITRGATAP